MSEIDLSGIQYVPPKEQQPNEKKQPVEVAVDKVVSKAKTMKKAMDKENEKITEEDKEKEMMDKQRLVAILQLYVIEFKDKLSQFKKTRFDKMSLIQLQELRKQFDVIISSKGSLKQTQTMVLTGIQMLETIGTTFTPIKCQGLYSAISMDPDALDDIKHISLKHMSMVAVEPEYRLIHKLLGNILLLHNINSAGLASTDKLATVNEKYKDL